MAIVTYGDALGEFGSPQTFFTGTEQFHKFFKRGPDHTIVGAEYVDSATHAKIDVWGDDLHFKGHVPLSGNLTEITLRDEEGHLLLSFDATKDHSNLPIKQLYNYATHGHLDKVVAALIDHMNAHTHKFCNDTVTGSINGDYLIGGHGNDRINGGDGDDWITGLGGNDTLTGGNGDDIFWFSPESGHDVITKFDADFSTTDPHQDYIGLLNTGWHKSDVRNPEDTYGVHYATQITFDDGSSVVLLNVHVNHVTQSDFYTQ